LALTVIDLAYCDCLVFTFIFELELCLCNFLCITSETTTLDFW
jgi:hypothetical protein